MLATPTTLSLTLIEALVTSYKLNSVLIGLNVKSHPVVEGINQMFLTQGKFLILHIH